MFVDSHCHLDRLDLTSYDNQISNAIKAAEDEGVSHLLCVAIGLNNVETVLDIAARHDNVHASVGVHPLERGERAVQEDQLLDLAKHPKAVAIGETGLDNFYGKDWIILQEQNFITHLRVANQCKKPVIIHTRDAREQTLKIMAAEANQEAGGVMHCFTESWEMAKRAMDMNFMISFSGIVTFKNASELREVAKKVPMDRVLIETDSPYLAPVPYRGKSNEPKYVVKVAEYLAELKGMELAEFARITRENYFRLFKIKA